MERVGIWTRFNGMRAFGGGNSPSLTGGGINIRLRLENVFFPPARRDLRYKILLKRRF